MKKVIKIFSFFTSLTFQVFAHEQPYEQNCLHDACGYVALTSAHIKGLYSWNGSNEVCIGVNEAEGFPLAQNPVLALEDSERFQRGQVNELPKSKRTFTAMGVSKPKQ